MNKKKILWISLAVIFIAVIIAIVCVVTTSSHEHTYASEWTQGDTTHWHATTCGHDVKKDEQDHEYVDGECSVCGYLKPTDGLSYTLSEDGKSYYVSAGNNVTGDIVIAGVYRGKPVTGVGEGAFRGHGITSIVFPDNITYLDANAFEGCNSLISVTIGKGVLSIGYRTFMSCRNLTSVIITNNVTSIVREAFVLCENLKSVVIGSGVTSIGDSAFDYCQAITKVFYGGTTEEEWNAIDIGASNSNLTNATRFYYSSEDPGATASGNFWHYSEDGVATPWYL